MTSTLPASAKHLRNGLFVAVAVLALSSPAHAQYTRKGAKYHIPYRDSYQRADAGSGHYLEIRGGQLYANGYNANGQLGTGNTAASATAIRVGNAANWVQVSAGSSYSLGLQADGSLWAWGNNDHGQLGNGSNTEANAPQRIGTAQWVSISAGSTFAMGIQADGTLWTWGSNNNGQLGYGGSAGSNTPIRVGPESDWAAISAGEAHALALKTNGTLWAWGKNFLGQLGIGTPSLEAVRTPEQVGSANNWKHIAAGNSFSVATRADGSLWAWGDDIQGIVTGTEGEAVGTPTRIGSNNDWLRVDAGSYHALALKANNTVWAWGKNDGNALGTGAGNLSTPTRIAALDGSVQISAGDDYNLAVGHNGTLSAWGANSNGNLGVAGGALTSTPTVHSTQREVLSTATRHGFTTIVLYSDGSLMGWGANDDGQLGLEGDDDHYAPEALTHGGNDNIAVQIGYGHALVLKADGSLWGWGDNSQGQLGQGNTSDREEAPVRIGTQNDWIAIGAGQTYSMGIRADGSLWTWGSNFDGEIGDGGEEHMPTPYRVGSSNNWVSVVGGSGHVLALQADGSIWGWGANYSGEAGAPEGVDPQPEPLRIGSDNDWVQLNAHTSTSLGLKVNGDLYLWGEAFYNQIPGVEGEQFGPALVSGGYIHGELGSWSCAGLRADGRVEAWSGMNMIFGDLGMGDMENRTEPTLVPSLENVVHISSGQCHKVALTSTRSSVCIVGRNYNGELGIGDELITHLDSYDCSPGSTEVSATTVDVTTRDGAPALIEGMGNTLAVQAVVGPTGAAQAVTWSIVNVTGNASISADGIVTAVAIGTVYAKAVVVSAPSVRDSLLIELRSGTGIADAGTHAIELYPNPTSDLLYIALGDTPGTIRATVLDRSGRVLLSERIAPGATLHTLQLGALAAGSYTLQLEQADGTRRHSNVVKSQR